MAMALDREREREPDKKVLVVTYTPVPTADRHGAAITALCKALARHVAVDLVGVKDAEHAHVEHFHQSRLLRVPVGTGSATERLDVFRRAVRRQLEGETYDVVHVRGTTEAAPAIEWRQRGSGKLVIEWSRPEQSPAGPTAEAAPPRLSAEEKRALHAADSIFVPSVTARTYLTAASGKLHADRIAVVPFGIDVDLFDWEPEQPSERFRVCHLGPLTADRDLPTLVAALRSTAARAPLAIRLVGDADSARRRHAEELLDAAGLAGQTETVGAVDLEHLPAVIAWADVGLVTAAATERFGRAGDYPLSLLQFLACRRATVAARLPAVEEIVRDGDDALLYSPGDARALGSALEFLFRAPRQRRRIAARGYERVRTEFTAAAMRRKIRGAYQALLDPGGTLGLWVGGLPRSDSVPSLQLGEIDTLIFGSKSADPADRPDTSPAAAAPVITVPPPAPSPAAPLSASSTRNAPAPSPPRLPHDAAPGPPVELKAESPKRRG